MWLHWPAHFPTGLPTGLPAPTSPLIPLPADNIFFAAVLSENQVVVVNDHPVSNPVPSLSLTTTAATLVVNTPQTLTATVVDSANGDAPMAGVTVTFTITGQAAGTQTVLTNAAGQASITFTSLSVGTSTVAASAPTGAPVIAVITWTTPPNSAPSCNAASVSPGALWPPNHKLVPVTLTVPDVDGDEVTVTVTSVLSTQPVNEKGAGNTCPDATIKPLQLRAERTGTIKPARLYRIAFKATDGEASCTGSVVVCVPHNRACPAPAPRATPSTWMPPPAQRAEHAGHAGLTEHAMSRWMPPPAANQAVAAAFLASASALLLSFFVSESALGLDICWTV